MSTADAARRVPHDVVIVGGGPAGVSAALWARRLGLLPLLLEAAPHPGGQLHLIHYVPSDFAGGVVAEGRGLAATMASQLEHAQVPVECDAAAIGLDIGDERGMPAVRAADGRRFEGGAVLIATGARRRHLGVPGERELGGLGVSYSATRDREQLAGRRVVVVGGGDAAFENALILAAAGCTITVVVRGVPRARAEFRARVAAERSIEVLEHAHVTAVLGARRVEGVQIQAHGSVFEHAAEGVVVKVGMMPNTEWCERRVELDLGGYVRVDDAMRTTAARVWAAGDVARPLRPSIAAAVGQGATALASIYQVVRAS